MVILLRQTSLALSNTNTRPAGGQLNFSGLLPPPGRAGTEGVMQAQGIQELQTFKENLFFQDGYAQPDETRSDKL